MTIGIGISVKLEVYSQGKNSKMLEAVYSIRNMWLFY